jgi:cobalt/nickel transport system permease protein
VGGTHGSGLLVDGHSRLHAVAAPCKLIAALAFIAAVVATPRRQWWAFVLDAAILIIVAVYAQLPLTRLLRRLSIELPFVVFAVMMPLIGRSPRVHVLGLSLSQPGLWAAWGILAKGTLGVATTILLASTTPVPQLLAAFDRLRVPPTIVSIMAFMIRYGDVLSDEMRRMRVARVSRGDRANWLWQARAAASSAGALFVRSYERGERVYLAMQSRGFTGSMPSSATDELPDRWLASLAPAVVAAAIATWAWVVR